MARTPTPLPVVVHGVVHLSSGSSTDWGTLSVAIAGVALSLASLAWQAYSFWQSGHRVRIELTAGVTGLGRKIVRVGRPDVGYPPPDVLDLLAGQGLDRHVLVATIVNSGRSPVTIHECLWETVHGLAAPTDANPRSDSFPKRLEGGGGRCQAVIEVEGLSGRLTAMAAALAELPRAQSLMLKALDHPGWAIFAVADLGTKRIRSNALALPAMRPNPGRRPSS